MSELFFERINKIVSESGLRKNAFAESVGITAGYLGDILRGRTYPSDRVIHLICEKHKLNEEWLRTGQGDMLKRSKVDRFLEMTGSKKGPDVFTRIAERQAPGYIPEPLTKGQRLLQAFALLDEERQERLIAMAEDMSTALLRGSDQEENGRGTNCAESNGD